MGTNVWAKSLWSNQIDLTFQNFFQQKRDIHKIVKRVFFGREFYKNIYIAIGCLFTSDKGTE